MWTIFTGFPKRHRGQDGVLLAVHGIGVLVEFRGTEDTLGKSGEVAHGVLVYST